jgi:transcriptional regulator with XRE-family HTH domain
MEAGLSVPYIANLENGRGNPTTAALARLAEALGLRLSVTLLPVEPAQKVAPQSPEIPASLVRLGRTPRFHQVTQSMAAALARDADQLSVHLVAALATLASTIGTDLAEADWWRLLDALLLITTYPAASPSRQPAGGLVADDTRR